MLGNIDFNYMLAFIVAFVVTALLAPLMIHFLRKEKIKQTILSYIDNHVGKQGTPTMGGLIFIAAISIVTLAFTGAKSALANILIIVFFAYGIVGFLDDFIKFRFKRNLGLRAYQKIVFQLLIAVIISVYVYKSPFIGSEIYLPFVNKSINIGVWIIPLTAVVFLAASNSVNLIDGLDGLAASNVMAYVLSFIFLIFSFITSRGVEGDTLLFLEYKSLLIVCCVTVGSMLAFLLFNGYPAKIFMGDTGSLALGSLVASIAIFTKATLFIPLLGIMFVVTAVSVIVQVAYYKLTKKRVFLMAPLHHHFERKGYHEVKIVAWYFILSLVVGTGVILLEIL